MKNMKCYGRKKTVVPKEKSFIRDFFDGNESSDLSGVFGVGLEKRGLEDYRREKEDDIARNPSTSPVLFQDFIEEKGTKNGKAKTAAKKIRHAVAKKCVGKKVKRIKHFKNKYCKSLQPRWSEFHRHRFTVEKVGRDGHAIFSDKHNNNHNHGNYDKIPRFKQTAKQSSDISVVENTGVSQKDSFSKANSYESRRIVNTQKHITSDDILQSSGDLSPPSFKKKRSIRKTKSNNYNSLGKNSSEFSKKDASELAQKINNCRELVNLSGPWDEKSLFISEDCRNSRKEIEETVPCLLDLVDSIYSQEEIGETVPCSLNLVDSTYSQKEIGETVPCSIDLVDSIYSQKEIGETVLCSFDLVNNISSHGKEVSLCQNAGTTVEVDKIDQKNGEVPRDISKFPVDRENLGSNTCFPIPCDGSKSPSDPLVQSFNHKKCTQSKVNVSDFESIHNHKQSCLEEEVNLNVNYVEVNGLADNPLMNVSGNSSIKRNKISGRAKTFPISPEYNNCDDFLKSYRKRLRFTSKSPDVIDKNYVLAEKRHIQDDQKNNSNPAKRRRVEKPYKTECSKVKEADNISDNYFSVIKTEILNLVEDTSKCSTYSNKGSNSAPFPLDVSNIPQSRSSVVQQLSGNFLTSTPVTKNRKVLESPNVNILSLLDSGSPISKSQINPKRRVFNHAAENDIESKSLMHVGRPEKENKLGVSLNRSHLIDIGMSFQINESPILGSSKKSLTVPTKNLIDSASSKRNRSLLPISSSGNALPDANNSDESTKTKLLKLCNQDSVLAFGDIYDWKEFKVKKIGEGTYGEVFTISRGKSSSVLKVIPVSEDPNVKALQGLSSVYSEVKISKCLSELRTNKKNQSRNFVKITRASVVSGSYPAALIDAWDDFSESRSTYTDRPDVYGDGQLFVILELEYGGKDMSCFALRNAAEGESVLKQTAISLAIAEEEFSFEHRDLHLGNILVRRTHRKQVSYRLRGKDISIECQGLQVTIIDFTLSILYENGYIYYNDLANDVSLFEQSGDCQFEVYKSMRRHLENKWEECSLYSNVMWLKYLCQKMIEFKYSRPSTAVHRKGLKAIDSFNVHLMECNCALECLAKCEITKNVFERISLNSDITKNSILVSRNSKSKLSICI